MKTLTVSALLCAIMALTTAAALSGVKDEGGSVAGNDGGEHHVAKRFACCPINWHEYDGSCFIYVPKEMTWAEAERNCQTLGGNLASVHDLSEHRNLQRLITAAGHADLKTWIGGSDAEEENVFLWSDGTPFRYTNWCPGEPNNHLAPQHCIQMNFEASKCWDDLQCSYRRPSVCAKKIQ